MKRPVSEVYCTSPYYAVPQLQALPTVQPPVQAAVPPPQPAPVPYTLHQSSLAPAYTPIFSHSLTPVTVSPALAPVSVSPVLTHFNPMMHFIDQVTLDRCVAPCLVWSCLLSAASSQPAN
ncbi:hypothetical protein Pmani_006338 [Petrolisthes manimaculis]|uniref:Uncharacterized protein n=1 Tax=Petrolisthes manimaculis TaxID=1843537 RepID=A0AAE1UL82_9EUCA|nr:hypothetical protein Pmani_006338 [Petrolisthes manimaculis]